MTNDAEKAHATANRLYALYWMLTFRQALRRNGYDEPPGIVLIGEEDHVERALFRLESAGVTELNGVPFGDDAEIARTCPSLPRSPTTPEGPQGSRPRCSTTRPRVHG